jgi:preprotein translocase SecE subunit
MARNRQRAKQRQAERREARLAERRARQTAPGDGAPPAEEEVVDPALLEAELAATAPPEDTGRSDTVIESPPPAPDLEVDVELDEELEEELEEEAAEPSAVRERPEPGRPRQRGKVLAFLANVWAELQRVQWPDRTALTSLTGIVLGFVLIAGGYLGLLDAIFSRVIKAIL